MLGCASAVFELFDLVAMLQHHWEALMAKKAKAKNGKKRGTAERVKPKSMAKFASARALFDHLSQTPREVKVNCTVHPIERDERRVMLTTDRGDWWAVHVTRI